MDYQPSPLWIKWNPHHTHHQSCILYLQKHNSSTPVIDMLDTWAPWSLRSSHPELLLVWVSTLPFLQPQHTPVLQYLNWSPSYITKLLHHHPPKCSLCFSEAVHLSYSSHSVLCPVIYCCWNDLINAYSVPSLTLSHPVFFYLGVLLLLYLQQCRTFCLFCKLHTWFSLDCFSLILCCLYLFSFILTLLSLFPDLCFFIGEPLALSTIPLSPSKCQSSVEEEEKQSRHDCFLAVWVWDHLPVSVHLCVCVCMSVCATVCLCVLLCVNRWMCAYLYHLRQNTVCVCVWLYLPVC